MPRFVSYNMKKNKKKQKTSKPLPPSGYNTSTDNEHTTTPRILDKNN